MNEVTRVTIRIPSEAARRMEVRARLRGVSANDEYLRAISQAIGSDADWMVLELAQRDIVEWLDESTIVDAQLGPVVVTESSVDRKPTGLITIERRWFTSDNAYSRVRSALANAGIRT